jgi:hypothetical protein
VKLKSISLPVVLALLACLPAAAQTDSDSSSSYTFTTINFTGDTFTQLLGINNSNEIAGYHGVSVNQGFTYNTSTKAFTNENYPKSVQTQVIGISNSPVRTVGFYIDTANKTHGFLDNNGTFSTVDFPQKAFNQLLGQNDNQQAVGYYSPKTDGSSQQQAFVYDENGGVFELIIVPNSINTQATGINNSGNICGFYQDSKNVNHGWLLVNGTLTVLNYPESTGTQALGLNNKGLVVGTYTDSANNSHGFTYTTSTAKWASIDDPSGVGTTIVNGVNDSGDLVGFYGTSPINSGFMATPN